MEFFYFILVIFLILFCWKCVFPFMEEKRRRKESEERIITEQKAEQDRKTALIKTYGKLSIEEIILNNELIFGDKFFLLTQIHGINGDDVDELIETAEKEKKKLRLKETKRKIAQKAQELYGNIPADDDRKPIPDEVKMFVWNRDNGKCVKCGSKESLEYDHIIPISKGGSNTERNIQLLCEKCNRSKRNDIV